MFKLKCAKSFLEAFLTLIIEELFLFTNEAFIFLCSIRAQLLLTTSIECDYLTLISCSIYY